MSIYSIFSFFRKNVLLSILTIHRNFQKYEINIIQVPIRHL